MSTEFSTNGPVPKIPQNKQTASSLLKPPGIATLAEIYCRRFAMTCIQ